MEMSYVHRNKTTGNFSSETLKSNLTVILVAILTAKVCEKNIATEKLEGL